MTKINQLVCLLEIIPALFNKDQESTLLFSLVHLMKLCCTAIGWTVWVWFIQLMHLHVTLKMARSIILHYITNRDKNRLQLHEKCSFNYSFNKNLLSIKYVPGVKMVTRDIKMNNK